MRFIPCLCNLYHRAAAVTHKVLMLTNASQKVSSAEFNKKTKEFFKYAVILVWVNLKYAKVRKTFVQEIKETVRHCIV